MENDLPCVVCQLSPPMNILLWEKREKISIFTYSLKEHSVVLIFIGLRREDKVLIEALKV